MRYVRALLVLFAFLFLSATFLAAQTTQTPPDTVFEMPGVFRISLPPGWQKTKVIDDRKTVAAFSSKDLTLEVMRDLDNTPAEQYARTLPDSQLVGLWDEYPGRYRPQEVLANLDPGSYESTTANRFDEYTLIGGLPAQWVRYRLEYKKTSEELRASRVWIDFILSPGQYWSLALRGDDRSWPASDDDLRRMVRSFQFLEPMLARVKAAIPPEAWKRMPSNLPEGSCQFAGSASGIGVVVPCDTKVKIWQQGEPDKNAVVGEEVLNLRESSLVFLHYVANWSAEEFSRKHEQIFADSLKGEKLDGHQGSYQQDDKREVSIDGTPGTSITATVRFNKARKEGLRRLLTVSKGTDHFYIRCNYSRDNSDQITRIFDSIQIFALHPQLSAVSSRDDAMADIVDAILKRHGGNISTLFDEPVPAPAGHEAKPAHEKPALPPTGHEAKPAPEKTVHEGPAPPSAREMERIREDVRLFHDSGSHYRLGKALDASGDHAAAFKEFETAVQLNPRNAEADREVARIYGAQNNLAAAIAAYQRVLVYSGDDDADAHAQLTWLYARQGNTLFTLFHGIVAGEAPSDSEITLQADEVAPAQKVLADSAKQLEAATKQFEEDPAPQHRISNRLSRADLVMKYGHFAYADNECGLVHQVDPRNLRALACLAQTADARGEQGAIVGYAQEWLALSPNNPEAYYWLARGYSWGQADFAKAAESYEAVIRNAGQAKIEPGMLQEAHLAVAFDYENLQLWQKAAVAHDSGVRELPTDAQVLNSAAWFFATTEKAFRNPTKALEYANRAVAVAPGDVNIMDTLAEAYFVNGRINDAVATEQKALALAPDRADLQKQMEKFKKAQQSRKTPPPHRK